MAVIESGTGTGNQLTVDPTSLAAHVTLYDTNGRALIPAATGEYLSYIETRHTGAPAAGVTIWNFRGPSSGKAYVRRIIGVMSFDGTAVAASTLRYGIYLGTGSASPTGGTARLAQKKDNTKVASNTVDIRNDLTGAGLTTTSITYSADPFRVIGLPISVTNGKTEFEHNFSNPADLDSRLVIAANEHIAIRVQTVAAVIGLSLTGCIEWAEW